LASLEAAVAAGDTAAAGAAAVQLQPHLDEGDEGRRLAAGRGAFPLLLRVLRPLVEAGDALAAQSEAFAQLMAAEASLLKGQPDLVTPPQPDSIVASGEANENIRTLTTQLAAALGLGPAADPIVASALRAVRHACTLHENNRQGFVTAGVVPHLLAALRDSEDGNEGSAVARRLVIREAARAIRVLTFDDDIRVAFGKGHEHAKLVVDEHGALPELVDALQKHQEDAVTVAELASTLGRLSVRDEYCYQVVDQGGLDLALASLASHPKHHPVAAACLGMLRAIAGNDDVKSKIQKAGGIGAIVEAMGNHPQQAGEWQSVDAWPE
jgi:hypothetical protein